MTVISATQKPVMHSGETRNCAVSFDDVLEGSPDETITGTPTITGTGMTVTNIAVTTGSRTINGKSVAAGKAVTFVMSGGTAGNDYALTVTVTTTSTPSQTIIRVLPLWVYDS